MKKIKLTFFNLLIILIILFSLVFLLFFFNFLTFKYLEKSRSYLLDEFKRKTGFTLSYESIFPNIIGSIRVYKVEVGDESGSSLVLGDLDIDYSIIRFIKNRKSPLSLLKKISLRSFNLTSEKSKIIEIYEKIINNNKSATVKSKPSKLDLAVLKNLVIEIKNGRLGIKDGESFININLTNFKINFKRGVLLDALLNLDANYQNKINLKTNLILNGEIKEFDKISTVFNIDFKTLNFNGLKFKRQKFVFENSGLNIKFVRLKDSLPLTFEVEKAESALNLLLKLDNYDIRDFFIDRSINIPNIPDKIYLNANISYDIKEKLTDGKVISSVFYNKIFGFDNIFMDANLNIFDNVVRINNLRINNKTRENFVDIGGSIPFNMDRFNFNINFKDFMFKNFKINSAINLKKIKNIITYNSDYLLLNGNDVGGLNVETEIVGKNKINVKSQSDFNGYNFSAEINRGKNYFEILLNNNFKNFNLSRIIKLFVKEIKEDFYLNGENSLKITNNNVFFEESLFYVSDSKGDVASFKLMLKNKLFSFYDIFVNKYNVKAKGLLDYSNFPFTLNADLTKDDFKLDMNSKIHKDKMIIFLNEKLQSTYYFSRNVVEVKSDSFKIPIKNNEIEINMDFVFDLKNKSIQENIVGIKNLNIFTNEKGSVVSKMQFAENKLILEDIVYEDEENKIVGNINHDIVLDEKIVVFGNGFLKDERKGESYSLTYKLADKEVDGKLYVSHLDMKKILGNSISGFLNLRFLVYGNVANPNIDFDGDITEAFLGKSALTGYFSAKKTEDALFLKRVFIQLGENRVSIKDSDIGLGKDKKKRVNINGNIYLESLSKVLKTDFLIDGEYDRLNPNIDLELNKINLGVLKKGQLASLEKFDNLKFNFSNYEDTYVFKNYGSKIIYFTKKGEETNLKLYNRNEAILDANIFLGEDNIEGKVSFIKFPVNAVYKIIYPYLGIENGLLDGTFDVKGTRKSPELYGRANLYYGVVNLPQYLQEKIVNISGIIVADKNRFLVNNVNGQVRKGNAHGYGEVVFNGLKFERYLFKISSDIVPALIKAGPVDARGLGKIDDFTIEGRDGVYNFIANLTIDEAEVNLASLMGAGGEKRDGVPKTLPINAFINFKAGKKVNINYPIIKGTIKKDDIFTLKYIGNEPNIYLGGDINLSKGEIYYFNKTFKIEQASFVFDENSTSLNPVVNIKSSYRTKDSKGEAIKLNLTLLDRLLSFKTEFSSFPYRSQDEIQGLLGINVSQNTEVAIKDKDDDNSDSLGNQSYDAIINTTNYLSNSFIFSPIENNIKRFTGLDTFALNTNFFGNILKSNTNLLDVLDESSLSVGKYISDQIYLGSQMSFGKKSGLNESFFLPLEDENYGLNLQFMLQVELQYISLGYSFAPRDFANFLNSEHKVSIETSFKF